MHPTHCHQCGGLIGDPATIEYRPPRASAQLALSHPGACTCTPPVVYQDPPIAEEPEVPEETPAAEAPPAAETPPTPEAPPGDTPP